MKKTTSAVKDHMRRKEDGTWSKLPSITCPACGRYTVTDVCDSRPASTGTYYIVRRRRKCRECNSRFTTLEIPVLFVTNSISRVKMIDKLMDDLKEMREEAIENADAYQKLL